MAVLLFLNIKTVDWPFSSYDSPIVLAQVLAYSPREYFFSPVAYQLLSTYNFTPWVILSWDLDFSLFQLDARAYRMHQLLALVALLLCIYLILYRHTRSMLCTFVFSLAIITAPASIAIASDLLTRHYLEGMVFSLLSFYCAVDFSRGGSKALLLLSVAFYCLALTAKEIFAPLPGILFFLFTGSFKRRVLLTTPYAVALLAYLAWRTYMLPRVGGYFEAGQILNVIENPGTLLNVTGVLLTSISGNLPTSILLLALFVVLFVCNLSQLRWSVRLGMVVGALGLLLPIITLLPLIAFGIFDHRWMFAPSVAFFLLLAYLCSLAPTQFLTRLGLVVVFLVSVSAIIRRYDEPILPPARDGDHSIYQKILESDSEHFLSSPESDIFSLDAYPTWVYVAKLYNGSWGTLTLFDPGQLLYHDIGNRTIVQMGHKKMTPVTASAVKEAAKGKELDLIKSVNFNPEDGMLTFSFSGIPDGQSCFLYVFGQDNGLLVSEVGCNQWSTPLDRLQHHVSHTGYKLANVSIAVWSAPVADRLYSRRYKFSDLVDPSVF